MSQEKIKLRSVRVSYVKGKYSFKQSMNLFTSKPEFYLIKFSGPLSEMSKDPESILRIYDTERDQGRLDRESRDSLKGLQMNLSNPKVIQSKGVTHIIVYECLNT